MWASHLAHEELIWILWGLRFLLQLVRLILQHRERMAQIKGSQAEILVLGPKRKTPKRKKRKRKKRKRKKQKRKKRDK